MPDAKNTNKFAFIFSKKSTQVKLAMLREELKKLNSQASIKLSENYIDEATSSEENFQKALKKEAEAMWDGMQDEMRKEGATEDFLMGFLKEGEEFLQTKLASYSPPYPLDSLPGNAGSSPPMGKNLQFPDNPSSDPGKPLTLAPHSINPKTDLSDPTSKPVLFPEVSPTTGDMHFDNLSPYVDASGQGYLPPGSAIMPGIGKGKIFEGFKQEYDPSMEKNFNTPILTTPAPTQDTTEKPQAVWDPNTKSYQFPGSGKPTNPEQPKPEKTQPNTPGAPPPSVASVSSNDINISGPMGGIGGFLISYLLGQAMGLEGPAAFLLPMLGGLTGFNIFNQNQNQIKPG